MLNHLTRVLSLRGSAEPEAVSLLDLTYSYDSAGRRTRVEGTVPTLTGTAPVTVDYTYDTASRLTGETRTQSSPHAIAYRYDGAGNRKRFERDGVATLWTVDDANRLVRVRQEGVASTTAVLVTGTTDDKTATVTVDGLTAGAPDRTQAPIHWSREVEVAEGEHVFKAVARDSLGNQTSAEVPVTVVDPTRREFLHDANGSLVEELAVGTGAKTLYSYDVLNRLTQVSLRAPAGGEAISSYTYDGEGKRLSATEGGVTTTYLYDGLLPVLERQGATAAVNVWGLSYGGGIGGLLARHQPQAVAPNARTLYPLYDGSGNILAWTDSTGAVASTTSYTAFGEVLSSSLRGGAEAMTVGFSTKAFSAATGLSYFGARYYRPDLARWLTPDPLGMVDGPNLYSYVRNNPVNFMDLFGLDAVVLNDSEAVGGLGHNGVAVGNDTTGWDYYSYDGRNQPRHFRYNSLQQLMVIHRTRYDRAHRISAAPEQDLKMREAAENGLKKPYQANPFWPNRFHCADLVNDTLEAGGILHGEETWGNPPNDAFNKIKQNNPAPSKP